MAIGNEEPRSLAPQKWKADKDDCAFEDLVSEAESALLVIVTYFRLGENKMATKKVTKYK